MSIIDYVITDAQLMAASEYKISLRQEVYKKVIRGKEDYETNTLDCLRR